jgi:hypothetical protein
MAGSARSRTSSVCGDRLPRLVDRMRGEERLGLLQIPPIDERAPIASTIRRRSIGAAAGRARSCCQSARAALDRVGGMLFFAAALSCRRYPS